MSFLIKDDEVWEKYEQIWDVIKNKLGIELHSESIYAQNFLGNGVPKGNMHYTCIASITIDFVMRMGKKPSAGLFQRNANIG